MRPRNRRRVSVLMIGIRPISSSSSAQVWAQDAKGWPGCVAGDTRELVRARMAGSRNHNMMMHGRAEAGYANWGKGLVGEIGGGRREMKSNQLLDVCFRESKRCADGQPPLSKSWWGYVRQS